MSVPDDGFPSLSSEEQHALETRVRDIYWEILEEDEDKREDSMRLFVDEHVRYLHKGFAQLPAGFVSLDASRPWICYWIVHSLALLGAPLPPGYTSAHVADFLKTCQHPKGGICGGQGQIPHLAPSYAGVMAALTVGGECLDALDRAGMASFLQRVMIPKAQGGGMHLHVGGEVDVRGCYTAAAVASTLGLVTPDLADSIEAYACACQTYEGGLGGEPWNEAHGGYTFCGLAALMLVGRAASLDLRRLAHWAVHRQGAMEGGFMGRTNKLVDGCYSFWQGGIFPLLERLGPELVGQMPVRPPPGPAAGGGADPAPAAGAGQTEAEAKEGEGEWEEAEKIDLEEMKERCTAKWLFPASERAAGDRPAAGLYNAEALQGWTLNCCQVAEGGLRDKPGKSRDYYHTCYTLSGLSSAQHWGGGRVLGPAANALQKADPLLNVVAERLEAARAVLGT